MTTYCDTHRADNCLDHRKTCLDMRYIGSCGCKRCDQTADDVAYLTERVKALEQEVRILKGFEKPRETKYPPLDMEKAKREITEAVENVRVSSGWVNPPVAKVNMDIKRKESSDECVYNDPSSCKTHPQHVTTSSTIIDVAEALMSNGKKFKPSAADDEAARRALAPPRTLVCSACKTEACAEGRMYCENYMTARFVVKEDACICDGGKRECGGHTDGKKSNETP